MKLDVYGRWIEVARENNEWVIYDLGEGQKRQAGGFYVPAAYNADEVICYLEDMLHEQATPERPTITYLEERAVKIDAVFNPSVKSTPPPAGLQFRLAQPKDREPIAKLMSERNPGQAASEIMKRTDREIELVSTDDDYRLFVAELNGAVIGLCRYYHSSGLPTEKLKFSAPDGWYGMGILVEPSWRRRGIARFLFENRLVHLQKHGAFEMYSIVDARNLTSIRMHEEFGFEEVASAPGFLHIQLESGFGILFRRSL